MFALRRRRQIQINEPLVSRHLVPPSSHQDFLKRFLRLSLVFVIIFVVIPSMLKISSSGDLLIVPNFPVLWGMPPSASTT